MRSQLVPVVGTLVLGAAVSAFAAESREPAVQPQIVLLITVDSLRASRLGVYGYDRPTTPAIDRLAATSYRFVHAYSPSTWTKPAMASMISGRAPHDHLAVFSMGHTDELLATLARAKLASKDDGLAIIARGMSLPRDCRLLPESLTGFRRAAFLNNPNLDPEFGFGRGWDDVRMYAPKSMLADTGRLPEMVWDVLRYIEQHADENLFIWIHPNDVHYPYGPLRRYGVLFRAGFSATEFRSYSYAEFLGFAQASRGDPHRVALLGAMYDAGLRSFDNALGRFLETLRRRGLLDRAAILLTADHGEELFEHGAFGHGNNVFRETARIPLLIKLPHQRDAAQVEGAVSLLDIAPTVLELAGQPPRGDLPGRSLVPIMTGRSTSTDPVLTELLANSHYELALVDLPWRLRVRIDGDALIRELRAPLPDGPELASIELYDLLADPKERHPLALADNAELVARLLAALREAVGGELNFHRRFARELAAGRTAGYELPLDGAGRRGRELRKQLKALGYLGGG